MAVTKKSKSFSSMLNSTLNEFKGLKIKTRDGILNIHRVEANLVRKFDGEEIHVKVYYKYSQIYVKNKKITYVEEELLDKFINDVINDVLIAWQNQEGVFTSVEEQSNI